MSLPLVVSAMKMHSMQIKNMRNRCLQEAYLVKNGLNKNFQPNLTSSKAHLHNRKSSRSTRKKIKKKSNRLKVVEENETKTKDLNKTTVLCNKNKQNQASKGLFPNPTCKNQAANNLNTSSVIICSARKLISSYSSKDISTSSKNMWKNPKISPRPKTSSGKKAAIHETSDIKIKRQSCPPPLFQPIEQSSVSKNVRLKKVYYSEAQSHMLASVPSVPPASPLNNDSVATEIVPCLADIKSQQLIKSKLRCLVTQRQKADEKSREKILKEEKRKEREQIESLKQQRRAEIYALNEVMTEHERNKFLKFMKEKHNHGATKISLNV